MKPTLDQAVARIAQLSKQSEDSLPQLHNSAARRRLCKFARKALIPD
jgi:hypothetical protein